MGGAKRPDGQTTQNTPYPAVTKREIARYFPLIEAPAGMPAAK